MDKTYEVTIVLQVTATSEEEALSFAVDDINECQQNGTLDAFVREINPWMEVQ